MITATVTGPYPDTDGELWMRVRVDDDDPDTPYGYYRVGWLAPKKSTWEKMRPGLEAAGWVIKDTPS